MPPSRSARSDCYYDQLEQVIGYTPMHDQLRAELVVLTRGWLAQQQSPHPFNLFHTQCEWCKPIMDARELVQRLAARKIMTDGKVQRLIDDPKFKDPLAQ